MVIAGPVANFAGTVSARTYTGTYEHARFPVNMLQDDMTIFFTRLSDDDDRENRESYEKKFGVKKISAIFALAFGASGCFCGKF